MSEKEYVPNGTSVSLPSHDQSGSDMYSVGSDDESTSRCGYLSWRPNCLQVFSSPKFLLVLLCGITFTQSYSISGINNVNVTSFERRFGLTSTRVGWIQSSYDICAGIMVLPISYFAIHGNKHLMMGVSAALLGLGAFIMWLPHILADRYQWGKEELGVCSKENKTSCPHTDSDVSPYFYVLIGGQLLQSLGGTTIYSVGVSSLDDCVSPNRAPVYLGIMYALGAIGPAVGYVLGGYLLDFYVHFDTVSSIDLTPEDPRWVGAWWIGYIIAMVLALLLFVPFLGLPKELPGTKEVKASKVAEEYVDESETPLGYSLKDLPRVMWMLLTNRVFLFATLGATSESIAISGVATFSPKFLENQFGQTSGFAAILTVLRVGVLAVPGAAGGFILGGYLCRRFKLTVRGSLRLCSSFCIISILFGTSLWMHCDRTNMAGINVAYNDSSLSLDTTNLTDGCNVRCGCSQENYAPVCDANGVQYFSACHAGCMDRVGQNYASCGCVNPLPGGNQTATDGTCETSCDWLYAFLPMFFVIMITTFVNATPITVVTLRCVPLSHKTFALGVQWMIGRLLGFVPGPLLFGVILDSACAVWKRTCDSDNQQSCWIYNNFEMRRNFYALSLGVKAVSALFFFAGSLSWKGPKTSPQTTESTNKHSGSNDLHLISSPDMPVGQKFGIDNPGVSVS